MPDRSVFSPGNGRAALGRGAALGRAALGKAALLALVLVLGAARADERSAATVGTILVAHAWARPTPPGAAMGAVYLDITNRGSEPDRLLSASTAAARGVEFHQSRNVNGMMQMRPVTVVECPAHSTVKIEPGGLHLMVVGLTQGLSPGEDFPLTLRFQQAALVQVRVHVGEPGQ